MGVNSHDPSDDIESVDPEQQIKDLTHIVASLSFRDTDFKNSGALLPEKANQMNSILNGMDERTRNEAMKKVVTNLAEEGLNGNNRYFSAQIKYLYQLASVAPILDGILQSPEIQKIALDAVRHFVKSGHIGDTAYMIQTFKIPLDVISQDQEIQHYVRWSLAQRLDTDLYDRNITRTIAHWHGVPEDFFSSSEYHKLHDGVLEGHIAMKNRQSRGIL